MRVSAVANDRSESAPRLALLDRKVIRETVVMLIPFRVSSRHIINPTATVRCELVHKHSSGVAMEPMIER
jgi:hypothetical protein